MTISKPNAYLQRRDKLMQNSFVAGCEFTAQQLFDMMCLALHDPEVMGKGHTIGATRLKRIQEANMSGNFSSLLVVLTI